MHRPPVGRIAWGSAMGKYLFKVSYTTEGLKGVMSEGAANRVAVAKAAAESLGGSVETFYFAFGDTDAYVIGDMPSDEAAAALAMRVTSSGLVALSTVKLLTSDQIDAAAGMQVEYRPPGS
jgi:uncharacterized protein with GYD domain